MVEMKRYAKCAICNFISIQVELKFQQQKQKTCFSYSFSFLTNSTKFHIHYIMLIYKLTKWASK